MATFGGIMQALFDRLGATARASIIERMVNDGKDRVVYGAKWPWLEQTTTFSVGNSVRAYAFSSEVGAVLALYDSTGQPVEPIERVTYDRLYRGNAATANSPVVYTEDFFSTTGNMNIHLWRSPAATTTLTLEHLVRVPDLSNATSTQNFEQIPDNLTILIQQAAEAAFHEWESSAQAPGLEAKYMQSLNRAAGILQAPVLDDGTR